MMRCTFVFAGTRVCALACVVVMMLAGSLVVSGCRSAPLTAAPVTPPAVVVMENLGPCAWRVTAAPAGQPMRTVTVPVGETVRIQLPAGTCEIVQEALAGIDASNASREFAMPLVAGEIYHWRLVTLATARSEVAR